MKGFLKRIFGVFAGKKSTQVLFELLYKIGLYGMNVGGASDLRVNGEIKVLHYIRKKSDKKLVVFDVGANVGEYTSAILKAFNEVEIHAFEPLKPNFDQLIQKFGNDARIRLVQKGIGEKSGKSTIHYNPEVGSMASVYQRKLQHHQIEFNTTEAIEIETISNYCSEKKITEIDFLKLDIEGHELAALKGAQKIMDKNKIRFIQFEFGGTNIDSGTYFRDFWYLLSPRYRIYRILRNGLREIKSYNESNEIFGYTNYFAELK